MDQDRDESHQKQLNSNSQIVDFNSKEHNNALQLAEENKEQVPKLKPDEEDKDTEKKWTKILKKAIKMERMIKII